MTTPKTESNLAKIKKEYETKYAAELANVKTDIENRIDALNEILDLIEEKDRAKVLGGAKFKKFVAALGVAPDAEPTTKKAKKTKTTKPPFTIEAVQGFIGSGTKTKSEISSYFKGGNVKIVKLLKATVKDGYLESKITENAKGKEVTNYKVAKKAAGKEGTDQKPSD